jgi:sterol desaturase/sphingolipid hydroxylase (fatty acid hydroxylase superfamily)
MWPFLLLAASHLFISGWMTGGWAPEVVQLHVGLGAPLLYLFTLTHDVPLWENGWEGVKHMMGMLVVYELMFYYTHRLFHTRWLKSYHLMHHTYGEPEPRMAMFGHPLEYVVNIVGPALLAPWICQASWVLTWLWFCVGTVKVIRAHTPHATNHHLHHQYGNVNFGTLDVLDMLHGTYAK